MELELGGIERHPILIPLSSQRINERPRRGVTAPGVR
jgi:hypothetical protein